ncbi:MAG: Bor family protein [Cytophagales bacterium]|nr:Bor family protein [Bernardetiaceae bacterium]MDW8205575.1 Bor family protein [Cytophagales bacterium]
MRRALVVLSFYPFLPLLVTLYTYNVGKGAQSGVEVRAKNHYLLFGLAPINTSDPTKMAGGATDYTVTVVHTFVDGLLNAITGGLYTPTTTIVKK